MTTEKTDRVRGVAGSNPSPVPSRLASVIECRVWIDSAGRRVERVWPRSGSGVISQAGVRMPRCRGRQTDGLGEITPRASHLPTDRLQPRIQGFAVHRVQVDGQSAYGKRHGATGQLAGTGCDWPLARRAASSSAGAALFLQQCRH